MMNLEELRFVWQKSLLYPSVHEWGWNDGPLSQKEILVHPQFG